MSESQTVLNNLITNLPSIIIALASLLVAFGNLKAKINQAISSTNATNEQLEVIHKTINSHQTEADREKKNRAEEKEALAVQLAKVETEKYTIAKAEDLIKSNTNSVLGEVITAIASVRSDIEDRRKEYLDLYNMVSEFRNKINPASQVSDAPLSKDNQG